VAVQVLYNEGTGKYVMWMGVDNANNTLGLTGVAVSDYRSGPYDFIRSVGGRMARGCG
jgi:hypothetical protein